MCRNAQFNFPDTTPNQENYLWFRISTALFFLSQGGIMTRYKYSELCMVGSYSLIRGFVNGYLLGKGLIRRPFFHIRAGTIRRDRIIGILKSLLDFENEVHFCIRSEEVAEFLKAVEMAKDRCGVYIKETKPIKSVEFQFTHDIFNKDLGEKCKELIASKNEGVDIFDYTPVEDDHPEYAELKMRGTAHRYSFKGGGMVYGDFGPVIDFYMSINQNKCRDFFSLRDLKLNYEDEPEEEKK